MDFEELDIKQNYSSKYDSIYSDFFNKILPNCKEYLRFGGIFSGKKFVHFGNGLQEFIKENGGIMQLVLIPSFDEEDIDAFKEKTQEDVIAEKWIKDLSEIKDSLEKDHVKALAWMIAEGRLQIKLILPMKQDGTNYTKQELEKSPLLEEVGIFFNKENHQSLSFRGKLPSKKDELTYIIASRPWKDDEKEQIEKDFIKFNDLWENEFVEIKGIKCRVSSLNDTLLDFFTKQAQDVQIEKLELKVLPEFYPFQSQAIESWYKNGGRGIFEMATGTGKTWTGIGCILKILDECEKLLVIVTAPYTHLIDQWEGEFDKFYIPSIKLGSGWTKELRTRVSAIKQSENKLTVLICTHAKFSNDEFIKIIEKCQFPVMVIVDEAHHLGAGTTIIDDEDKGIKYDGARKGLLEKYQYRVALSATIERYYDGDGTEFLESYFTGTEKARIINFDLKQAIDGGYLCKYSYYPKLVKLTEAEFLKYKAYTSEAMKTIHNKDPKIKAIGERILQERSVVIRDAENKYGKFIEIMKEIKSLHHLLVFNSGVQFPKIDKILLNAKEYLGIDNPMYVRITAKDPANKKDRIKILREFADEFYKIILSNRVLDEGLNIPQARMCIVLASTGNPTQFIQRRGRVLRRYDDTYKDGTKKTEAIIYDILVQPEIDNFNDVEERKLELNMIKNQLKRLDEFGKLSKNADTEYIQFRKEFTYGLPEEFFKTE